MKTRSDVPLVLALALPLLSLAGCVAVKPHQRGQLAERCMVPGFGDVTELRFRIHWEGSRRGMTGGFTTAEGGCGCN